METVNNLASAASRAIWGETTTNGQKDNETKGQEPLSGETGDVEAGEPYDKGNAGTVPLPLLSSKQKLTKRVEPTSTPAEPKPVDEPTTEEPKLSTLTSNPKVTDTTAAKEDKPSSAVPITADPSSAPQETQKLQGADRPTEIPSSEEHDRIKETKKEADEAAAVNTNGPGPKTLEEKTQNGGVDTSADKGENAPQKESHSEGTGELYVKSSGMKADGGDFDATKPGAGKEADREFPF